MRSGTFNSVNSLIENMTDEQLKEIHNTLHTEALKRGMVLSNIQPKGNKDKPKEGPDSYKSIESL